VSQEHWQADAADYNYVPLPCYLTKTVADVIDSYAAAVDDLPVCNVRRLICCGSEWWTYACALLRACVCSHRGSFETLTSMKWLALFFIGLISSLPKMIVYNCLVYLYE
jgi:hypothetical protein